MNNVVLVTQSFPFLFNENYLQNTNLVVEPNITNSTVLNQIGLICCAHSDVVPQEKALTVQISPELLKNYLNRFCLETLYPFLHSKTDVSLQVEDWVEYKKANDAFAITSILALKGKPHSALWIFDYHLMLVAPSVRKALDDINQSNTIGLFLSVPFPSWEIFKTFPWKQQILQGLLNCDLIGFQVEENCLNFLDCCERGLGCRVDRKRMIVQQGERTVRLKCFPVGVHFQQVEDRSNLAITHKKNIKAVLGIDHIQGGKEVLVKLQAYKLLLTTHKEMRESTVFLQILLSENKEGDDELFGQINETMETVNEQFSTSSWTPVQIIHLNSFSEEILRLMKESCVALFTQVRDGSNLFAKEFVASKVDNSGVLILSEFSGTGSQMLEALTINPWDMENIVEILHRALSMSADEQLLRMSALRLREKRRDFENWLENFIQSLSETKDEKDMDPTEQQEFEYLSEYFVDRKEICLLLDYDGTLSPITSHPDLATLPEETRTVLTNLAKRTDVNVAIISGREVSNLQKMVGIKDIIYAGNHGLQIVNASGEEFAYPITEDMKKKVSLLDERLQQDCCHDGAWVENKTLQLTYHYRNVENDKRAPLIEKARKHIESAGFKASPAHCALESKPLVEWDKGRASFYILKSLYGLSWSERVKVIYVGDDTTDEDAIAGLKGLAYTFRVTSSNLTKTSAKRRLPCTDSVLNLLKWVDNFASDSS